jgi:hypothetical protein
MGVGDQARKTLTLALDKGIAVQQPTVEKYIARARQRNPAATPSQVIASLERQYLSAVITLGGASGAAAAAPAVGTGVGLMVNIAEVGAFIEASALFSLAVSDVHGVEIHDLERRRTLLMAVLMGNSGSHIVEKMAGKTGTYWAKSFVKAVPMAKIDAVNKVLGPRFITKYGTKQGTLVLGRDLPFGFGAAIGVAGNAVLGRMTVAGARRAFGPAPQDWPPKLPSIDAGPGSPT